MRAIQLDKNSNPRAPYGSGWYVVYGDSEILDGPFITEADAICRIETLTPKVVLVDTDPEKADRYYVIDQQGKMLTGPFRDYEAANSWIENLATEDHNPSPKR